MTAGSGFRFLRCSFAAALAFEQFKQRFHLRHDAAHFSAFGQQAVIHHTLVHLTQFLADVTEVAHHLFAL